MIINRWLHRPVLHTPRHGHERKVGWLELFYDLVYVATFIQMGNALSVNVTPMGFVTFATLFLPIWFTWTGFTFFANRFVVDDAPHRLMVFGQMFAMGAVAVGSPGVFNNDPVFFTLAYTGARVFIVLMYARTWLQVEEARDMSRRYALGFGLGALVWLTSAFVPTPYTYVVWGIAMCIDLAVPMSKQNAKLVSKYPPDVGHMVERYGLLTIIVLGESFVKLLTVLIDEGPTLEAGLLCGLALSVTCSLWWVYFDDVAGSRIKPKRIAPWVWIYSHMPLTLAITAVGVAVKKAVMFDMFVPAPTKYRWMLCGSLALAFFFVGAIDSVTERRHSELSDRGRVNIRWGSALVILLFAQVGQFMLAWVFLLIVAVMCILQVLFDLLMAPTADEGAEHEHDNVFEALRDLKEAKELQKEGQALPDTMRRANRNKQDLLAGAVRRGVPNELRKDLYFHFMEGSWTQLLVWLLVMYCVINLIFAGLFMLEPGSIDIEDGSFIDAFAFSVQTFSTIGYGAMSPQTAYGHVIVTIEAAFGLIGVAVATGLILAKIARPQSSVLFSNVIVITKRFGKPTLMFRLGNARGNEVVEARVRVAVLCEVVSPEGHNMVSLFDLKLKRDNSPLFRLSWSVLHEIDENSPIYGFTAENILEKINMVVVTMTGFDATYAQTVHARHLYHPEDVLVGHRLVDVIERTEDGHMVVEYGQFHDTEPDPHWDADCLRTVVSGAPEAQDEGVSEPEHEHDEDEDDEYEEDDIDLRE